MLSHPPLNGCPTLASLQLLSHAGAINHKSLNSAPQICSPYILPECNGTTSCIFVRRKCPAKLMDSRLITMGIGRSLLDSKDEAPSDAQRGLDFVMKGYLVM